MQRKWYRSVLEKDIDAVNGACADYCAQTMFDLNLLKGLTGKKEGKTRLMNMVMQVNPFQYITLYGRGLTFRISFGK